MNDWIVITRIKQIEQRACLIDWIMLIDGYVPDDVHGARYRVHSTIVEVEISFRIDAKQVYRKTFSHDAFFGRSMPKYEEKAIRPDISKEYLLP